MQGGQDREAPRVVGVLLAAGQASRFGSPKQLATLGGRPLVTYALGALLAVEAIQEVVVVVGAYAEAIAEAVAGSEAIVVSCPDYAQGLAASLRCGVIAAQERGADAAVVHLADLPGVGPEAVAAVLAHAFDDHGRLHAEPTRATYAGTDGHPVVLPRACFGELAVLTGDVGARDLLRGSRVRRVELGHLADPTDIDTPDQLEAMQP
jgi:CTP:molybdopterin cytidylyltransferase MocA